jgi:lipoprotein signal peptidase
VTRETEEEMVERRSQNADAAFGFLLNAYDWFWIVAGILIGLAVLALWLLG